MLKNLGKTEIFKEHYNGGLDASKGILGRLAHKMSFPFKRLCVYSIAVELYSTNNQKCSLWHRCSREKSRKILFWTDDKVDLLLNTIMSF